jgi:sugar/nucleoside kinase (ribokinase family)
MTRALILGGVSYNLLIYLDTLPAPQPQTLFSRRFHETVGSTGAGKALSLSKLGLAVTLHAPIGADRYGDLIRAYLDRPDLTFLYDLDPAGTQRHVNLMDAAGQRISIFINAVSFDPPVAQARLVALLPQHDIIVLNIANYCRHLIPAIQSAGRAIWCDIHDYDGENAYHQDFIAAADYLFLSSDRLLNYRTFMEEQIAAGKCLVVCTHGKEGATALTSDGQWITMPVIDAYGRVDTNGAGDNFFAGFLFGYTHDYPVEQCMRLGTIVSGLSITTPELVLPELTSALVEAEYHRYYGALDGR